MTTRIAVVGAGIIGLTSALRFRQAGFQTEILTRERTSETTSAVAAAFWYPYRVGNNRNVETWANETHAELGRQIARGVPGLGVARLREYFDDVPPEPWWRDLVGGFTALSKADVGEEYSGAYEYTVPLADTPVYLPWVENEVRKSGATIRISELTSLEELSGEYALVVNCAGVWSRTLAADPEVYPIRGQIRLVTPIQSSLPEILIFAAHSGIAYVVRRSTDCVLGGTAQEGKWELAPDGETARAIRERCERLEPALKNATVLRDIAGLRPGRREVRLELERGLAGSTPVIHNYGHGGAGYTLCWACADAAVALAKAAIQ